jgi:uncharacterized OB-fold protein
MGINQNGRPVPLPDDASAPFFDGARRGELMLQACAACGAWMWPVKPRCVECWSEEVQWRRASGRASVYSFAVMHGDFPGFASPYVLATVETEEGVRFTTDLAGVSPDQVHIGMSLAMVTEQLTPDVAIPGFRPAPA